MLLVGGMTTREAATALFLSPKTVEHHLRHVYRKLDVRWRENLATAVGTWEAPAGGSARAAKDSSPARHGPKRIAEQP